MNGMAHLRGGEHFTPGSVRLNQNICSKTRVNQGISPGGAEIPSSAGPQSPEETRFAVPDIDRQTA